MRLIDADALKQRIREKFDGLIERIEINSVINAQPKADVVERKRGEWLETSESIGWEEVGCAECSVCGKTLVLGDYTMDDIKFNYNYCPNCGAEMKHD